MKSIFTVCCFLVAAGAMADSATTKILKSQKVATLISQFENDKKVDCLRPKETQINWYCIESDCDFRLDITCVSRISALGDNDQILRLSIAGNETRGRVTFDFENNRVREFEKLKELN